MLFVPDEPAWPQIHPRTSLLFHRNQLPDESRVVPVYRDAAERRDRLFEFRQWAVEQRHTDAQIARAEAHIPRCRAADSIACARFRLMHMSGGAPAPDQGLFAHLLHFAAGLVARSWRNR